MSEDASVFVVDVCGAGHATITIRRVQLPATVRFTNSCDAPVTVTFTTAPPFTDPTRVFTVPAGGTVNKTVPAGTSLGKRGFTCSSGRTGDIDIIA